MTQKDDCESCETKNKKVLRSALTFGTRNWTVRDNPPSHEAISIMKPAEGKQIESNLQVQSVMVSVFQALLSNAVL